MSAQKRKSPNTSECPDDVKTRKLEICPHKEHCFRRNPHHFKEYEHPHLLGFIQNSSTIPDGLPQAKHVYEEQISILKALKLTTVSKANEKNNGGKSSRNSDDSSNKNLNEKFINKGLKEKSIKNSDSASLASGSKSENQISKGRGVLKNNFDDFTKCPPDSMLEKLKNAAPYNIFFTTIPKSPATLKQPNSITFTDLLCPSLGTLKCSLQINFMIDIMWLMEQYKARNLHTKPMTILYGEEFPKMEEYMDRFMPNVTYHFVKMKDPFGTHHSKIGLYFYEDNSLRVVVSTANLYYEDWNHYNQGLWLSPRCPNLPEGSAATDGESPTGFKISLINYLETYSVSCLKEWIDRVKKADFSAVRVFLVTSVPGKHYPKNNLGCHLHRIGDLLSRHCSLPVKTTPESEGPLSWGIIAQASSIGSLGKSPADWLRGSLLRSLSAHKNSQLTSSSNATLSVIFPTVNNVLNGYFGPESGGCLPYSKATNEKQRWLQQYLHQWKADRTHRTRAMPHIKSYCRVSPCLNKLAWFLLTSSNISKSAWGGNIQKDYGSYVRSYEAGVLFLPKMFDEEYFEISNTLNKQNKQLFPFMYDLPLTSYKSDDYPWCN